MSIVLGFAAAVMVLAGLLGMFARADSYTIARFVKKAIPASAAVGGLVILSMGLGVLGGVLFAGGLIGLYMLREPKALAPSLQMRSAVRTAALDMELDHETGALEGLVLAGTFEGHVLSELKLNELVKLYSELYSDSESRQLLEAYLDSRAPLWREHAQSNARRGQGVAPRTGAMTKEEAYKVLGLETGATPADVRKAHSRLMQRLRPDIGRSPFLVARIDEAKDVLLSDHG